MYSVIQSLSGYLWGFPMIALLFCTHIFMTVKTGCIQRRLVKALRLSFRKENEGEGEMSPFASLSTTLASTLGTGNIIGVGTAVALGGAGAVFWCWLTGVLGMATQYAEVFLSVKYRRKNSDGSFTGGPMYVLRDGLGSKYLAFIYALISSVAVLITGSVVQSNAVCTVIEETLSLNAGSTEIAGCTFSVAAVITAAILGTFTAITIFSSVRSLGNLCQVMVPFMALVYVLGAFAILIVNRAYILKTVVLITKEAFSLKAAGGGFFASSLMLSSRYGVARGLFSNEAGLGTSSIVSALSNEKSPVRQGLASMTATFWDTVVMCAVTGVAIVSALLSMGTESLIGKIEGGSVCYLAFSTVPFIGKGILVFSLCVFAFSTIAGLSCVGVQCAGYFLGKKGLRVYLALWVAGVFLSPYISLDSIWNLADILNALLVIPNVCGLYSLWGEVKAETSDYFKKGG